MENRTVLWVNSFKENIPSSQCRVIARDLMESNVRSIECSLERLKLCPQAVLAIWPYGAIEVNKSCVTTPDSIGNQVLVLNIVKL